MDVLYSYFVYVFLIAEEEITLESLAIMPDNVLSILMYLIPKAGPRALLVQKLRVAGSQGRNSQPDDLRTATSPSSRPLCHRHPL